MSFNRRWLRGHQCRFICIYLEHSRKMCDDKISHTRCKMLHNLLTTDQKENQFFFLSEFNNTGKGMKVKIKNFPESYELCGKHQRLYKTTFESLSVNYQGGFARRGGELRLKEYSSNPYQFSLDNTSQISYTSSSFREVNGIRVGAQPWHSVGADEMQYKLHLGTKLDCIMYFNTKQLRHSEMTLL